VREIDSAERPELHGSPLRAHELGQLARRRERLVTRLARDDVVAPSCSLVFTNGSSLTEQQFVVHVASLVVSS
jgi:hypothetical protein